MMANPFVGLLRVAWMEFRAHLRSPRLVILAALFALVVLGVSYGSSRPFESPFANQTQLYVHPTIANESGVLHYGLVAYLCDFFGAPKPGQTLGVWRVIYDRISTTEELLREIVTNESGFIRYDIGTTVPDTNASLQVRQSGERFGSSAYFFPALMNQTFTLAGGGGSGFSTPVASDFVVNFHILDLNGVVATAVNISLNETSTGHPDEHGFYALHVPQGDYMLNFTYKGYTESQPVSNRAPSGPVWASGADAVLALMTLSIMPLLLPIVAIAVSFDAVARERVQGSMELLLSRRVTRAGILSGKFVGAFVSVLIPVLATILAGIGLISTVSGSAPSAGFATLFIVSSLFLVAVYILLMLLLSTLAKSVGTAVVFGVVVAAAALWLVGLFVLSAFAFQRKAES